MSIFYQQSGQRGEADFPKTIGSLKAGLRNFTAHQVASNFGVEIDSDELQSGVADREFQIWGVPSGASRIISSLKPSDIFLLIGRMSRSELDHARFFYAGRVVYVRPQEDFGFSRALWGEGGFPLIFFMQGALINYTWREFIEDFAMASNYYVAGQTMRLSADRLASSRYKTQGGFEDRLGIDEASLGQRNPVATVQSTFEEGSKTLSAHLLAERSHELVEEFKQSLKHFSCTVCGFDFERTYGEIGRRFIEAHHLTRIAEGRRRSTIADLVPVCSNCHRMLHRHWPSVSVDELAQQVIRLRSGH